MKINTLIIALAAMSVSSPLIMSASMAQAPAQGNGPGFAGQGQPGQGNAANFQERRQRMLERFDTNHDGVLDDNERAQMRAAMDRRRAEREQNGGTNK